MIWYRPRLAAMAIMAQAVAIANRVDQCSTVRNNCFMGRGVRYAG